MSRVGDASHSPTRTGSPSHVFSHDILNMDRDSKHKCTRTTAVILAILATVFLLSTIALAIVVGIKYSQDNESASVPRPTESELADQRMGNENRVEPSRQEEREKQPAPAAAAAAPAGAMEWPLPTGSLYAKFKKAAIASDHGLCSEIGRDVMIRGGNAVESMIAALLCIGVVNPQSSGIGGGFLMTMYNSSTGKCVSIDARESAPAAASATMFVNATKGNDSVTGYRSIATPSELHGFWTVFQKFGSGKVSWASLFEPSIKLATEGFPVSSNLAMVLEQKKQEIMDEPTMKEIFVNSKTGQILEEGDILKREQLASTLQLIANATDPIELFYKGGMAQSISEEIREKGGHVTAEDLASYETLIHESPLVSDGLGSLQMCGPPPPSSFAITQSIIAVMAEFYRGNKVDLNDPLVYHRLIEAEKFAYAQRTNLGDVRFVESSKKLVQNMTTSAYTKWIKSMIKDTAQPQNYYSDAVTTQKLEAYLQLDEVPDHGTSHVTVIDEHGNAVSSTSTVNQLLGSMRRSPTLGIIWNDEMDDFSTPGQSNAFGYAPSEANFIAPGKRPMSSMSPMIIYDKNENRVKMVTGASGGSYIISSTAQTVIRTLVFNQTVKQAVDAPRLHNQFLPHETQYETTAPKALIKTLEDKYKQKFSAVERQKSVVQALEVMDDGFIHGNSDFRRQTATYPAGF